MVRYRPRDWRYRFLDAGLEAGLADAYLDYVDRMYDAGVPPIFDFTHLSQLLGRSRSYVASVVSAPDAHYREFRLPKRRGGWRTIAAPYPALLECQRWVLEHILTKAPIHDAAHGFRLGRSIITNARMHVGAAHILKLDLEEFFPSIPLPRVVAVFRRLGYPGNVSFYLAALCTLSGALPQGAATSPCLSNAVVWKMDSRLAGLAQTLDLQYTRYADDLTFSGPRISVKTAEIVASIVSEEGFRVNSGKTHLCRGEGKRVVTGISVAGDKLRVPRGFRRRVRQETHYVLRHGPVSHTAKLRIGDPLYLHRLYGKLLFWQWVEPDEPFVSRSVSQVRELIGVGRDQHPMW